MTVADQISELLADAPSPPAGDELVPHRERLAEAAARAVELVEGHDVEDVLPLRLPKGRVVDLLACERLAVARHRAPDGAAGTDDGAADDGAADDGADDGGTSVAVLRGQALDRFVQHELHVGPVADPVEDLLSMLAAEGDEDLLAEVAAAAPRLSLDALAAEVRGWAGVDPAWWPRTQTAAAVHLAGGRVRCEGRVDVELGGPLSGRPGVVVEVKVGRPHASHLAEATHYALLVALRDGVAPALLARWYPGGALAHQEVTADVLDSASRRLAAAIGTWAELQVGRAPEERPGSGCAWCPDADRCPSFREPPDPFDTDGDDR